MMTTLANDPTWTRRYESLRRHFLAESGRLQSAPLGLLLFIREGLAAWMRSWNQEPPVAALSANHRVLMPPLAAVCGWQRELTFLIAHITILHLEPLRSR